MKRHRRGPGRSFFALVVLALVAGCSAPSPAPRTPTLATPTPSTTAPPAPLPRVQLVPVASGFEAPILVVADPEGLGRLFVAQQDGRVLVVGADGAVEPLPFLDVSVETRASGEQGFLGFAFSPRYTEDGVAFGSYTDLAGDSVLARYHRGPDGRLLALSEDVLLRVDQPYANHNGGGIVFGPDGFLYYGLGDGGSAGDPHGNAQDKDALLGSMLRIDVSGQAAQPASGNPWGSLVWAKGLRNPWRFSFDRATGDLWIGDVGQNAWEEVDVQPASSKGGENYGWSAWEGTHSYGERRTTFSTPVAPIAEYSHAEGCSVVGGFVYRGKAMADLRGVYLFGDYCSGKLWGLRHEVAGWNMTLLLETRRSISSFGEDAQGEVLVVDRAGSVLRLGPLP